MRTHRRPFDVQNRVHHGVPPRPVRHQLMAAQNPVELRAEPLDRRAAGEIEEVSAEFHCHTVQYIECVAEHQQLGLRVDAAAPRRGAVPGVADLESAVRRVDVQVARRADQGAVESTHHEGQPGVGLLLTEPHIHPLRGGLRRRCTREPQATHVAVGRRCRNLRNMVAGKGFQRYPALTCQRDRLDEGIHDRRPTAAHATTMAHTDSTIAKPVTTAPM